MNQTRHAGQEAMNKWPALTHDTNVQTHVGNHDPCLWEMRWKHENQRRTFQPSYMCKQWGLRDVRSHLGHTHTHTDIQEGESTEDWRKSASWRMHACASVCVCVSNPNPQVCFLCMQAVSSGLSTEHVWLHMSTSVMRELYVCVAH